MLAYFILLLHVVLIAGLGVLIIFFKGIVTYFPLIVLAGLSVIGGSAYYVFKRLKIEGKSLRSVLNSPLFSGKSLEIRLLGGAASIKIDGHNVNSDIPEIEVGERSPLEDPTSARIRKLTTQAKQLENDYFHPEAYQQIKRNLHS